MTLKGQLVLPESVENQKIQGAYKKKLKTVYISTQGSTEKEGKLEVILGRILKKDGYYKRRPTCDFQLNPVEQETTTATWPQTHASEFQFYSVEPTNCIFIQFPICSRPSQDGQKAILPARFRLFHL